MSETYKVYAYAYGREYGEVLEYEFDNLEDGLDEMRKEWQGHPRRLEMPDGTNYEFEGEEWERRVHYKYLVLREGERTATQTYLLNKISKTFMGRSLLRMLERPNSFETLAEFYSERTEDKTEVEGYKVLSDLITYDLIELVIVLPGSGFQDPKWRN